MQCFRLADTVQHRTDINLIRSRSLVRSIKYVKPSCFVLMDIMLFNKAKYLASFPQKTVRLQSANTLKVWFQKLMSLHSTALLNEGRGGRVLLACSPLLLLYVAYKTHNLPPCGL